MTDDDITLIRADHRRWGSKYTAGKVDRRKYDRLADLGWLMPTATNIDDVEYYATEKGRAAAWSKDRAQEREEVIAFEVGCVCRRLRRRRRSFEASSSLRRYGALFARPTLISQSILTHAVAGERIPSHLITSDTQIVHHIGTIVQRLRREYDLKG